MTEIYLIRHGVTDNNVQGIFQGLTDAPLSEKGLRQAECLGERFREEAIDAVYASPLLRTIQTAQGANRYKQLPIRQCSGIIELNGGEMEGRTMEENMALYPKAVENMFSAPALFAAPGGESMRQVYDRVSRAMLEIAVENEGKRVIVVSHGCAIRAFLHFITGLPFEEMGRTGVSNAAISKFVYDPQTGKFSTLYREDTSHLFPELQTPDSQMYRLKGEEG